MVARIAPEPITVGVTFNPDFKRSVIRSTRPVEDSAAAHPDPRRNESRPNPQSGQGETAGGTPQPSPRPPGKDPSIPPQALMDASLISADFKPDLKIGLPDPAEPVDPVEAATTPELFATEPEEQERGTASQNVPTPTALVLMEDALGSDSVKESETRSQLLANKS